MNLCYLYTSLITLILKYCLIQWNGVNKAKYRQRTKLPVAAVLASLPPGDLRGRVATLCSRRLVRPVTKMPYTAEEPPYHWYGLLVSPSFMAFTLASLLNVDMFQNLLGSISHDIDIYGSYPSIHTDRPSKTKKSSSYPHIRTDKPSKVNNYIYPMLEYTRFAHTALLWKKNSSEDRDVFGLPKWIIEICLSRSLCTLVDVSLDGKNSDRSYVTTSNHSLLYPLDGWTLCIF